MRFTQTFMDEIRDRVPISDVIGNYVTWDKRKTNTTRGDYWACSPFVSEKTPSFHCVDPKGFYKCFSSGESGDHFTFLTKVAAMSFPEAVERVANMAGVPMPAYDPEEKKRDEVRRTLYDVMEWATKWFERNLQVESGAAARAYLRQRGLSEATIAKFRLGFAPNSRNQLKEFLASQGATKEQIEASGMVIHGEDIPVSYDRFRDRIMFPIEDAQGRVIAFGGRAMDPKAPAKYLNSPETELFHKSDVLFNLKRARAAAAKAKDDPVGSTLITVEGYMDVIALDQAGVANAVAPLGTALTERQLQMIWRVTGEPVLCFDGDKAGLRAAYRSLDMAMPQLKAGRSVRFALLPDGQDPDDLVRENGRDAFAEVITKARSAAEMLWQRETGGKTFETPERRAALEAAFREITGGIEDTSVRRHYQQEMRERTNAFFGTVPAAQKGKGTYQRPTGNARSKVTASARLANTSLVSGLVSDALPVREAALISAVLCHPDLLAENFDMFCAMQVQSPALRQLRSAILKAYTDYPARDRDTLMEHGAMKAQKPTIDRVDETVKRARLWVCTREAALDDAREAFAQAVKLHIKESSLASELNAAERALADESSDGNLERLIDIRRQMDEMQSMEALIEGFGIASGRPNTSF
ncbi:MAG: DNA primase [Pseudomonadota bacterium]